MHRPTVKSRFALPGVPMVRLLSVLRRLLITECTSATDSESASVRIVCSKSSALVHRLGIPTQTPDIATQYAVGLAL